MIPHLLERTVDRWAEGAVLTCLDRIGHGQLTVEWPGGTRVCGKSGGIDADIRFTNRRAFRRIVAAGEIGVGESYMDGDWTTRDLVALVRLMLANEDALSGLPGLVAWIPRLRDLVAHRRRDNTAENSRRNIHRHYDLGNAFFKLFLDANLLYSCALFDRPDDSLEAAQVNKLRTICEKLDLGPRDHVLEIGTGWGGFALYASSRYGCRVTTTTISREQHAYAARLFAEAGDAGRRIELRLEDYRALSGRFDKVVSIEMFEAVGFRHYDEFFGTCERLLAADGTMLLQTITVDDWRFRDYLRAPNWIAKHIFPGAELASVAGILRSLARVTRLNLHHAQQIGTHYARTLHHWRDRFHRRLDEVRDQGFDERFIRMWDLYLGYCEAAFLDRHIGDVQLVLTKAGARRAMFDEPWSEQPAFAASDKVQLRPRSTVSAP